MLKDYSISETISKKIHFFHGNSMTYMSYEKLLNLFSKDYNIKCSILRPLTKKNTFIKFKNWDIFLNDYLDSIKNEKDIIGIGHSIGGNILLKASILYPEKFKKVFLLDPTFFTPSTIYVWKLISLFNLQSKFLPLIDRAKNKKMSYDNINQMYQSYRKYKVFSNFKDDDLRIFVNSLVTKKNDSYELIFDRRWDAEIYKRGLLNDMFIWKNIKNINLETCILKAENSDVFLDKTKDKVHKLNSSIKIIDVKNSDHLFPINNYLETFKILKKHLN